MGTEEVEERTVVYLGNRSAVEAVTDPETGQPGRRWLDGKRCTTIVLAPGLSLMEAANEIAHSNGVWAAHSREGTTPAWVASTDPALAQLLATHFKCELRDPEPDHVASGDVGMPATVGEVV